MDLAKLSDDRQNDLVPTVLSLMATHITDPRTMCSLLQLNTSCRTALQQSTGRVSIASLPSAAALRGLSAWLPAHAGLVHELGVHLQQKERYNCYFAVDPRDAEAFEEAVRTALRPALRQCKAAAATPPWRGPHLLPLRLASFKGHCLPINVLACLPTTITCLDLEEKFLPVRGSFPDGYTLRLQPAVVKLARNLKRLRLISIDRWWDREHTCDNRDATQFTPLTLLTRLDLDFVLSTDAAHLPTSLVELKLSFKVDAETPWLESDPDEVDEAKHTELLQAALHLHLTHLRRLQRCELRAAEAHYAKGELDYYDVEDPDAVTLHLAAPHLTRLQLDGDFQEVTGLEPDAGQRSRMKELCLKGTSISIGRLVALMARMPELQDFQYQGCMWDEARDPGGFDCDLEDPEWRWITNYDGSPRSVATPHKMRELGAALGAATQLTSLFVWDMAVEAHVAIDGSDDGSSSGDDDAEDDASYGWVEHLCGLARLCRLELGPCIGLASADVLQLSTLTALTLLRADGCDLCVYEDEEEWDKLRQQLPHLQLPDPFFMADLSW